MVEIAPFAMVVLIVAIVAITRTQRARYAAQAALPQDAETIARLRSELKQLHDRVSVLERIATDGDHLRTVALEREIDALRDARS